MIRLILLQNRQGKTRLAKYYVPLEESEKHKVEYEVALPIFLLSYPYARVFDSTFSVSHRDAKFTNFVEAIIERMTELEKLE